MLCGLIPGTWGRELRAAAELTLDAELERLAAGAVRGIGGTSPMLTPDPSVFEWIRATVDLARAQGYELDLAPVAEAVTAGLVEATRQACASLDEADAAAVEHWIALSGDLGVTIDLGLPQELAYDLATHAKPGQRQAEIAARLGRPLGLSPVAWSPGD